MKVYVEWFGCYVLDYSPKQNITSVRVVEDISRLANSMLIIP